MACRNFDTCLYIRLQLARLTRLTGLLGLLDNIRDADWAARRSLRIGTSAGAPVHWVISDDQVMILIGHDDETWDIAVAVPVAAVEQVVSLVRREGTERDSAQEPDDRERGIYAG